VKTAAAVFVALLAARAAGFWSFVLGGARFDAESVRLLLGWGAAPLLLALALWIAAWGSGRRALRVLRARGRGGLVEVAAAALGLGLLGQCVFALGWAGLLSPVPLAALAMAAAVCAVGALPRPARPKLPRLMPAAGAAAGLLAFAGLCVILRALAPATDWDVRAYHLAVPELYLRAGRSLPLPWLIHSHWPHLMETLYALPLAAGRDGAAALLHAGAAALLVFGVFLAGSAAGGPVAGWSAALLLAAQPALLREAGTAHCDAGAALFALAAAAALARAEKESGDGWLAAAGLLAGLGAACKLTMLAPLAAWTLRLALRRRPRAAAVFAGAAALMVAPWFLKEWLASGDPVWPFAPRLFGLPAAAAALGSRAPSRWSFPPPAWMLSFDGPGYLLLPLAGLAALSRRARAAAPGALERLLWIAAGPLLLLVWREHGVWRYLMPVWAAGALAAGRGAADAFAARGPRRAAAVLLLVAGAAPIILPPDSRTPNNELFAVLAPRPTRTPGADRRELFEDRSVDVASFYRETASVLPPRAKVLLFREIRGYRAGFDYMWGDPMNQVEIDYASLPDPAALCARLKELGVTHVLDHPASTLYREDPAYYDARTLSLMSGCLRAGARVVLARDGLALHQLL